MSSRFCAVKRQAAQSRHELRGLKDVVEPGVELVRGGGVVLEAGVVVAGGGFDGFLGFGGGGEEAPGVVGRDQLVAGAAEEELGAGDGGDLLDRFVAVAAEQADGEQRWCSRSSVDRIARRGGLTRVCLGEGRNGIVRFVRMEVEQFEASRRA